MRKRKLRKKLSKGRIKQNKVRIDLRETGIDLNKV